LKIISTYGRCGLSSCFCREMLPWRLSTSGLPRSLFRASHAFVAVLNSLVEEGQVSDRTVTMFILTLICEKAYPRFNRCSGGRLSVNGWKAKYSSYVLSDPANYSNDVNRLNYIDTENSSTCLPPILFLLGTAQSIQTYSQHISAISKTRRIIIPELRGQGKTLLDSKFCTINQHISDIRNFLRDINVRSLFLLPRLSPNQ
jgi:hypothetical protein